MRFYGGLSKRRPPKNFVAALNNIGSHDLAIYSRTDFLRMSFFSPNVSYCSNVRSSRVWFCLGCQSKTLLAKVRDKQQYWLQTCNTLEPCLSVIGTLLLTNPLQRNSIFKYGLVDSHLEINPVASNQGWSVHSGM